MASNLPIVPHYSVTLDSGEERDLARLAERILVNEPTLPATDAFGPNVTTGFGPWPSLALEDHSAISLFDWTNEAAYSHRAMLLAGDGDFVAISTRRNPGFERYCRDLLKLGDVTILVPEGAARPTPFSLRCAGDPRMIDRLTRRARLSGGLNVVPYMGTGGAWRLAATVAGRSRTPVSVAAPPPRLTRRVNDKLWFARRVAEVLGAAALPPAHAVFGPTALAGRIARLSRQNLDVAVKLADSASAAGNIVLHSAELKRLSAGAAGRYALMLLRRAGWQGDYPLMITAWEQPVLTSLSVHLWIPDRRGGPPVVEGIFEQELSGAAGTFVGARPSGLPGVWRQRIAHEAARLGTLFQLLGYFGRCSFDAIVVGARLADARLHWIECNGRWGGASIPMTLANRLTGDWARQSFTVIERADLAGPGRDLSEVLMAMDKDLFRPGVRSKGAVMLSPARIEDGSGYQMMIIGEATDAISARVRSLVERSGGTGAENGSHAMASWPHAR